jgi:hypothetical protein
MCIMRKLCVLALIGCVGGCGPRYYIPNDGPTPGQLVVSAYTQDDCTEELQEEARDRGLTVKLKRIETDLGWQIFLFPLYKGYRCFGDVTGPAKP